MLMPSNTEAEVNKMRVAQAGGVSRSTILPGKADCQSLKEGYVVQVEETFAYLRRESFNKRQSTPSKLHWCPMEIVQRDSKHVDQMIDIMHELQIDGAIRGVTP